MFGPTFRITTDRITVVLRAATRYEAGEIAAKFSSPLVHRYTLQRFAFTQEMEQGWYDKNSTDNSQVTWVIVPEGSDVPVGSTGLHAIDLHQSCTSGIIIFDPDWWGKGVASAAHLVRTWYATKYLDRATIKSEVMSKNVASRRALERVGYCVVGTNYRCRLIQGNYVDSNLLSWWNPVWVPRLFPDGFPNRDIASAVERAQIALEKAEGMIEM